VFSYLTKYAISRRRTVRTMVALAMAILCGIVGVDLVAPIAADAQEMTPEMLDEAARQTGLSREELLRRYRQQQAEGTSNVADSLRTTEPGRTSLDGIDDRTPGQTPASAADDRRFVDNRSQIYLPFDLERSLATAAADSDSVLNRLIALGDSIPWFGRDFFKLDADIFNPPSFGPVPADYVLGVGDEVIVDVWGGVELRISRIVDRDGSIILPEAGRVICVGRTLEQVATTLRRNLEQTHSSIDVDGAAGPDEGDTRVEVSLGRLRAIRVFVVGAASRPGSYQLSSVATVMTALYAAGGPTNTGSMRQVRVLRGQEQVAELDLYDYMLGGLRTGDVILREGDTVFVGDRGPGVLITGEVKRPMRYEMKAGEELADLIRFAGGFAAQAAPDGIHIRRTLPPAQRRSGQPDQVYLDVVFDVTAMAPADGSLVEIIDGDIVRVDAIEERLENWVEITGSVKRPGIYQFVTGMTFADLAARAGGLWPDALLDRGVIDRTSPDQQFSSFTFALASELAGEGDPVLLQAMDVVHVFSRWDVQERPQVHITGEVHEPVSLDYREGMTLRDLVLKAGGLRQSADLLRADVARVRMSAVRSRDTQERPNQTVEVLQIELGPDFLMRAESLSLRPHDRVAVRKLPWWEMQRTVKVTGEVFYPGVFSLERQDETLSSVITRAGGLKPDAYVLGARVIRSQDDVGNIAVDLVKALMEPGSQYDIILQEGDEILVPDRMYTVKVVGEVGFPTSLVFESGHNIDYYVGRAGGYLEKADRKKARVVYPNGMSLPNKGGSKVVAGSTIIVPIKPPPEGPSKLETLKEITAILAGVATIWLVIDRATE